MKTDTNYEITGAINVDSTESPDVITKAIEDALAEELGGIIVIKKFFRMIQRAFLSPSTRYRSYI